jgi:DNA-directed RNA polymerase subunit alpha
MTEADVAVQSELELATFFETDEFPPEALRDWAEEVFASRKSRERFGELLRERAENEPSGLDALRVAVACIVVGHYEDALSHFTQATDNATRHYYAAQAHAALRNWNEALSEIDRARDRGWDEFEADMCRAEFSAESGDVATAQKLHGKYSDSGQDRARWHFIDGMLHQHEGRWLDAIDAYERGLALDPDDTRLMFRCAYLYDLHGDDDEAIELYERLASRHASEVNALLNLSVIYEDRGEFAAASRCVDRVLEEHPNHIRARLFAKDVRSSIGMYLDDSTQHHLDSTSKLADTPLSEFELSVRARNCLSKMNIHTMGDLLRISEEELLSYKNFGETSLREIKALLTQRGLRLGQSLENLEPAMTPPAPVAPPPVHVPPGAEAALNKPVSELELSVRARKCLQRLNISSIGELITHSEQDLLAIRNFGVTSLNEIKLRLKDLGLSLAGSPS